MDKQKINLIQSELKQFIQSNKKKYYFSIDCGPEERIEFIYSAIFPGFAKYKFYWRCFIARIAQMIDFSALKVLLYRSIGVRIGKGVFLSPDVFIDPHFPKLIEIGDYCIVGWGSRLFTHESSGTRYRLGRISLGRGSVIGGCSTIRGGVFIDEMVEIPYGGIVYRDIRRSEKAELINMLKNSVIFSQNVLSAFVSQSFWQENDNG